jgi:prevent-host-death family protein
MKTQAIDISPEYTDNTNTLACPKEAAMAQTTAVEFQRKFGAFQHQAQREPVEITRHGRRDLVLMSADHSDWLIAAARRTPQTANASSVVVEAVRRAEMDRNTRRSTIC